MISIDQKRLTLVMIRWIVLVTLSALVLSCGDKGLPREKPNVLWILLDTLRAENLSCYGYERETSPNIDALASRGALFENNFSQATWTGESVSTYMTGRYFPAQYLDLAQLREVRLPADGEYLLPEIFSENGYQTAMVTMNDVWFSYQSRIVRGFDQFIGVDPENPVKVSFEELNEQIIRFLERPPAKPYFLYVHAWDTHFPHNLEPPFDRWIDKGYDLSRIEQSHRFGAMSNEHGTFSAQDQEYLRSLYDGSISFADYHIGRLMEWLETAGELDNLLIIISSDHGEALAEDGRTIAHAGAKTYDEVTRVPLILAGPRVPRGTRVESITENVDIFPTIVELASLDSPAVTNGESLIPTFSTDTSSMGESFAFTKFHGRSAFSLRGRNFRYEIRRGQEFLYPVPDKVASRRNVLTQYPAAADVMRTHLLKKYVPLSEEESLGPLIATFLTLREALGGATDRLRAMGVVAAEEGRDPTEMGTTDDRWLLYYDQLFSASFSEDAPTIELRTPVKNGRYNVLLEILCDRSFSKYPASSLDVLVEDEVEFRTISCDLPPDEPARKVFIPLGKYDIVDGFFDAEISEGESTMWASFSRFALVVDSQEAMSGFLRIIETNRATPEEEIETIKKIEALGYI